MSNDPYRWKTTTTTKVGTRIPPVNYSYSSQKELEELYDKFQELVLPLSAILLDIDYMDGYRIFAIDKKISKYKSY